MGSTLGGLRDTGYTRIGQKAPSTRKSNYARQCFNSKIFRAQTVATARHFSLIDTAIVDTSTAACHHW